MLLAEGLTIAGLSYVLACALSVPLTLLVDRVVGNLGFLAPLPFVLSPPAALAWLGLATVAEGIEEQEQRAVLRKLKCQYGQGYLFSRPVPAIDLEPLLASARVA